MSTQLNFDRKDSELLIPPEADTDGSKENEECCTAECCNCECMSIIFALVMFLVCGGGFAALFYFLMSYLFN